MIHGTMFPWEGLVCGWRPAGYPSPNANKTQNHTKPYKTIQSQQRCLMIFRCAEAFSIKNYLLKSLSGVLGAAGAAYPCPTPWSAHGSNWWTYPRFWWSKRDLTPESFSRAFRCFGGSKAHKFHDLPRVRTGVHRVSPSFSDRWIPVFQEYPHNVQVFLVISLISWAILAAISRKNSGQYPAILWITGL